MARDLDSHHPLDRTHFAGAGVAKTVRIRCRRLGSARTVPGPKIAWC